MKKKARIWFLILLAVAVCSSSPAFAELVGPSWDVPGSFNVTSSDPTYMAMGYAGGLWLTYENFDTTQFTSLYYGPANTGGYIPGLAMDGGVDNIGTYSHYYRAEQFTSFTAGTYSASDTGYTEYYNLINNTWYTVGTRMELWLYDLDDNLITWVSDSVLPDAMYGCVADVYDAIVDTGGFKVNIRNYANNNPFLSYYNSLPTGSYSARMEYNDAFWHETTAPVPEPATMLLLGSGLVGLAGFRRKMRNKRQ